MRRPTARILVGAALLLCLQGTAWSQASKLDARLRMQRRSVTVPGGIGPAGATPPSVVPSTEVYRVMVRVPAGTSGAGLAAAYPGVRFGPVVGEAVSAFVPDASLDALAADGRVLVLEAARRMKPTLDVSRSSTVVGGVYYGTLRNGLSDVASATGAGVVVGIVDTGIDWNHRDFSNDGTPDTTRILSIWDQTISSHSGGAFPSGYTYGAEYTRASIDAKLAGGVNVINTQDTNGHGTHVASIAAGDGSGTYGVIPAGTYKGYAPGADIVMVKTDFTDAGILDGVAYILAKAAAAGKRAVINLSLGGQAGPHDGTSTFETGLSAVAASTPVFVAAGNDHDLQPHAKNVYTGLTTANFSANFTASVTEGDLEFWHPSGDAYSVTVTLFGLGTATAAVASGTDRCFTIGGHTVLVYNATNAGHPQGDKQILVAVTNGGAAVTATQATAALTRTTAGGSGRVDGFVDPSIQGLSWATFVDNTLTMAVPATALNVLSIGSFASKYQWLGLDGLVWHWTSQASLGSQSLFSGVGPTRDGRQAPELVAPGDGVVGALSSQADPEDFCDYITPPLSQYGCQILQDNAHLVLSGTSMAAPTAAGIAASRLALQPALTNAQLQAVLRALARTDGATGSVPNSTYGYGKVTASPQPVSPPSGFTISALGTSSITWSWGAVTAATDYRVYYATNTSSLLTTLASPSFTQTGLTANTTYGLFVRGMAGSVDGPGTTISTSTYAGLAVPGAATGYVSSVTLAFTACAAAPQSASCSGYTLTGSTDPAFGGVIFASATSNRASTSLTLSGLQALTTYYLRLAALNSFGGGIPVAAGSTMTITDLQAPILPTTSEVSSTSIRFHWAVGANPLGLTYIAQASTSPSFSPALSSTTVGITAAFYGVLSVNTSYYFRVQAASGPFLTHGPVPTNAVSATAAAPPFPAVSSDTVLVDWQAGLDPPGTRYFAELSAASDFSSGVLSSATLNTDASFAGLTPNTRYYARVTAVGHNGASAAALVCGSTATLAQPVTPLASPFSAVLNTSFTFSFGAGANPAGTRYIVRISTDPGFSVLHGSSNTASNAATFAGLDMNQLYHAQAAAINQDGAVAPYSAAQSTATTLGSPGFAPVLVSTRSQASLTMEWLATGFAPGTQYRAEAASDAGFTAVLASSVTRNPSALLSVLPARSLHYLRVRALSQNAPTPDGPWVAMGQAYTYSFQPTAVVPAFTGVGFSSFTVFWSTSLDAARVEASLTPDYAVVVASVIPALQGYATFTGLQFASTYYVRVGALNGDGLPHYGFAGSTLTLRPLLSSGTAVGGGVTLTLPAAFAALPTATLAAEAGTFPNGATVRIVAGTSLNLSAARGAVPLTPLGTGVAFDIDAGGNQPLKPVRLTVGYDAAQFPGGQDARRLRLARYDEASGLWQLAPSAVDTRDRTLTATLDHFSVYAPFFATAGTDPDQTVIYPNPWEVAGDNAQQRAQAMTFANLPDGASLKVLTMAGELVWEAAVGPSGIVTWDGNNRFGHKAGSATYYVVIKSGGRSVVKRAVLIR